MRRLEIPNGGMPLEGDDLIWMQDAFKEALQGVTANFSDAEDGYLILSGCIYVFNGTTYSVSAGFVMLNNEICYHAGSTGISNLSNASFRIVTTYDAAGNDVFQDGQSKNTYAIRNAVAGNNLTDGAELILSSAKRLSVLMANNAFENVQPVSLAVQFGNGWSSSSTNIFAAKRRGKLVHLEGGVSGGSTNLDAIRLPEGSRPGKTHRFTAYFDASNVNQDALVRVTVRTDGWISLGTNSEQTISEPDFINLSSVSFWLD